MFENVDILRMAGDLSRHAQARQTELARNIANADTPGFRAHDVTSFADALETTPSFELRTNRAGHLSDPEAPARWRSIDAPDSESPNGNTVSLENQMLKMAEVAQTHDEALAVYSSALRVLRASIGAR